jgi:uncharacterized protein (TIGR01319 family)
MTRVASFDIGSTWTKGALFELDAPEPHIVCRSAVPTTIENLAAGVARLLARLLNLPETTPLAALPSDVPCHFSSSAKGGLAMAAVGIVPDLTLHAARLAAASAGARIVACYAYQLGAEHIAELERLRPDIILFSGGTDGGNERCNLHNARALAASRIDSVILYAGNALLADTMRTILSGKRLLVTDNLMPEVGQLRIEPARQRIQEIFLQQIVEGKGLGEVAARCIAQPRPTPLAVFDLLAVMAQTDASWNDLLVVDLGGATTDVYSVTESFWGEPGFVLKGLCEPKLKRTVEGDLGLRLNAPAVLATARQYLERALAAHGISFERLQAFVAEISCTPDHLPSDDVERRCDEALAGACVYHGLLRHAGRVEETYGVHGKLYVQRGKDLRRIRTWIGTGGYLAALRSAAFYRDVLDAAWRDTGGTSLLPRPPAIYADARYLLPLLGNLAHDYPAAAVTLATRELERLDISETATR